MAKKKKKPIPVDKKIEKLIEIYKEAEKGLIKTIALKQTKGNITTFYKEMLKQVQKELLKLQVYHTQWATDITKQLYEQTYKESLQDLGISDNALTQLHKEAIELIANNLVNNLNSSIDLVGRRIADSIREIGLNNASMKFATGNTIKQMQKQLTNNLIDTGLCGIKDKLGRTISMSAYAEMLARSIVAETQNTCVKNTMNETGNDLVKMSEHYGACKVCIAYEGRVYSISGNDTRFPYLYSIPGFKDGYNNLHPRCRHRIRPWIEKYNDLEKEIQNSNRPFEVDKDKEASIRAYQKEQKEKARLRNDKKQYERYKEILGEEAPKSLQSFRKIKYNNSEKWKILRDKYKFDLNLWDDKNVSGNYQYNTKGHRLAKIKDIKRIRDNLYKYNIRFIIDRKGKILPEFAAGGFNPYTGEVVLRKNPTYLSLRHENFHVEQYIKLGKDTYLSQTTLQREEYVYSQIMKYKNEFDDNEIYNAQYYIYTLRNGGEPPPNWKGY